MKLRFLLAAASMLSAVQTYAGGLSQYVNPFIGASTSIDAAGVYHGLGKTFPGAATPFGMTQVSPNTITGGDNGPGYSDEHRTIEGFAFTQMSGIGWYGDLGNLLTMPTRGRLRTCAGKEDGSLKGWRSTYDKDSETASAGYYLVRLADYGSISSTLENAYTDWCTSILADACGDAEGKAAFLEKGQAYRNVFDAETGWFRPRGEDGSFEPVPENGRLSEGYGCAESNPFQQGWFVPHDMDGLFELIGGREKALEELDYMFSGTPLNFQWNQFYNHANEPVHFIPFLYNLLGQPCKTQKWTRTICRNAYFNAVEGLCGNEDCGQMSAWYILAASGIHPVCPGGTRVEITSPMFSRVEFRLDPVYHIGDTFTVIAHDNSDDNLYIQKAALNGRPLNNCYIDYYDIAAGGTLELWMGPGPSQWGIENQ